MLLPVQLILVWTLVAGWSLELVRGLGGTEEVQTKPLSSYKWKTGPWGTCHSPSECGEGQQMRSVWCAHSEDRISLKVLCDPNTIPEGSRPCFQVCAEHRGKLSWRVGDWGPCLPLGQEAHHGSGVVQTTFHSTSRYLRGVMIRDVVCVFRKNNHSQPRLVSEEACKQFEEKPNNRLSCTVPRSQDCIVTEFGPWLSCRGCSGSGNRTRIRRVLVASRHGGRPCPKLSETEICKEAEVSCLQHPQRMREYKLRIGPWSDCFSLEHNHEDMQYGYWASVGYQTRDVTCKDENGIHVDIGHCVEEPQLLVRIQACVVNVDCLVSSWSDWNVFKEGCITLNGDIWPEIRKRTRQILRVPLGSGQPCPHLEELHVISEKGKLASCSKYKWVPSEWSDCVLTDQLKIRKVVCGGGIRRRNITCLRSEDQVPVDSSLCLETSPPVVHRCSIPCQQDCVVSPWSAWGPCQPLDCRNTFNGKLVGYQERTRTVLIEPTANGQECPSLRQVDTCGHPSCYLWRTTEFSPCVVLNKELKCGQGKQSRKAVCVDLKGTIMGDSLCSIYLPEPELIVPCYIPCPNDCVLSAWSEWSPCSKPCADDGDEVGKRSRNRTILAPAGHGGAPCPIHSELTEHEICNQHSCFGFGWKVSPWDKCEVYNSKEKCGAGYQTRVVSCMKDDEIPVIDKKCRPIPRSHTKRNCTVSCPKQCQLTKYSDWSSCGDCTDNLENKGKVQERVRYVLGWPEEGQDFCPANLNEVRDCPSMCGGMKNCTPTCNTYSWSVQEWGTCVLPDNVDYGNGYRTRGVTCLRNNHEEVEISFCLQLNHTAPEAFQPCYVYADNPCVFSEWSKWSSCPMTCGGTQIRTRTLLSDSPQLTVCQDPQKYPLSEARSCSCNVLSALANGEWSDCILDDTEEPTAINGVEFRDRCGVGRRLRRVGCYDKSGSIADPFLCTPTGYEEDACMVGCPIDCQMSSWSEWSSCSVMCGNGIQYRSRKVIRTEFEGGRPCPQVNESKVQREVRLCSIPCHQFHWMAYGWKLCELNSNSLVHKCGSGHQTRQVRCFNLSNSVNGKYEEVKAEYCDPALKPTDVNYCHIPCPMDCVVSEWGEWSVCPKCDGIHVRQRSRYVVRSKPMGVGVSCPLLDEKALCVLNENCYNFAWNLTEWTSCTIPDGATCGEGVKQRGVVCLRSDDRSVELEHCRKTGVPPPEREEVQCMVDCPIDCEVSPWSEWYSEACKPCGESGMISRRRHVLVNPSLTGRPCPTQMVQRKPCLAEPCYHWQFSSWSECDLGGGQCGHGKRRREVACKRNDSLIVDRQYCLKVNTSQLIGALTDVRWLEDLLDIQEEESCFVPCPGDCIMTEWSDWSPCHRDCSNGEQVGIKSRSRAIEVQPSFGEPCSRDLYETKPCFGGPCFTYTWQVHNDDVICVRSDGLIVIGGCHGKPRPCVPVCRIPFSECSHSGECLCKMGYRPVFRETNSLEGIRELLACELVNFSNSSHHTGSMATESEIRVVYFPDDNEVSLWMYAMIAVGSAFVIFVAATIYVMCHSTVRRGGSPMRRPSLTIRNNTSKDVIGAVKT
ncbi:thrombospondin, type I, domain containing [Chamberlinius hualienensis]